MYANGRLSRELLTAALAAVTLGAALPDAAAGPIWLCQGSTPWPIDHQTGRSGNSAATPGRALSAPAVTCRTSLSAGGGLTESGPANEQFDLLGSQGDIPLPGPAGFYFSPVATLPVDAADRDALHTGLLGDIIGTRRLHAGGGLAGDPGVSASAGESRFAQSGRRSGRRGAAGAGERQIGHGSAARGQLQDVAAAIDPAGADTSVTLVGPPAAIETSTFMGPPVAPQAVGIVASPVTEGPTIAGIWFDPAPAGGAQPASVGGRDTGGPRAIGTLACCDDDLPGVNSLADGRPIGSTVGEVAWEADLPMAAGVVRVASNSQEEEQDPDEYEDPGTMTISSPNPLTLIVPGLLLVAGFVSRHRQADRRRAG